MDNSLYYGDNLDIMKSLLKERGAFIDLVYIDPPFNSKRDYNILYKDVENDEQILEKVFKDTWSNVHFQTNIEEIKRLAVGRVHEYLQFIKETTPQSYISYLSMMAIRLHYIRELLKETGSLYLHCDPTMSHYLKVICDLIFGADNFKNEIVWGYKTGGIPNVKGAFARKHDVLLFYAKNGEKNTFNKLKQKSYVPTLPEPHTPSGKNLGVQRDDLGKFRMVETRDWWVNTGVIPEDDIKALYRNDPERLGYPTQKPRALLKRIIEASTNKGGLVADFFCGCGTTIDAAIDCKRKYLGADIHTLSIALVEKRIGKLHGHTRNIDYSVLGFPQDIAQATKLAADNPLEFQKWAVNYLVGGIVNPKKTGDKGIDGWFFFKPPSNGDSMECIVNVKGGANLSIDQVRSFIKTCQEKPKRAGIMLVMGNITDGMRTECANAGSVIQAYGNQSTGIPRCGIFNVAEIIDGRVPDIIKFNVTFTEATKAHPFLVDSNGDNGEHTE